MAWMLCELPDKLRVVMTVILYGPSLAGNAYMIWTLIFADDSTGFANAWLMSMGITDGAILWLHKVNIVVQAHKTGSLNYIIVCKTHHYGKKHGHHYKHDEYE